MPYHFTFCHPRKIQAAQFCLFDQPMLHPSRNMPVHDFVYVTKGEWSAGIENEIFTVQTDDILILPANITHVGIKPCSPKTRTMYFHLYPNDGDGDGEYPMTAEGVTLYNTINASLAPNIKDLFRKIIQTQSNETVSSAYVNTLLYELGELSRKPHKSSFAYEIYSYIVSTERILNNQEIARHFNISTKTAEVVFKREYQCTIHSFVMENTLKKAQQYLIDYPNMKMNSIATMLGFCDEFHFSKAFKSGLGMSPSEFRRKKLE